MEKPDEWDVLRLRALQVVTQVLSGTSFKCRVGQVVEEDEVCQMLNLLIEAAILTIQEYGTICQAEEEPLTPLLPWTS